ncbi:DUF808 domain-containing protein [Xylophilus ampelinus]|uniref:DUF808 domain-containing protein n=1 Tax=Xylophilus ampelinus TaxID=54067 RepID=A0A318SIY6_9BURK|nr:DUF808 domain-containing protein [Xylophilus ampelinus]MCS4509736.1 DUF808 domain-containing protein [Xylophilus ampelinus]PYE78736.1 hypothetical protein DFQ15_10595 [Xylophilus ampelinus]
MAGASLLTLLDDIAAMLDDVALMTKVAAKKSAGVLGDDLALNAQQVSGVQAARELPVVWAVSKGSMRNKAILVPAALAISAFAPWLVTPLLMLGGAFLCYEGVEKLVHVARHRRGAQAHAAQVAAALPVQAAPVAASAGTVNVASDAQSLLMEKEKVQGAIRTDFILSAEIIAITLGAVAGAPFLQQLAVLVGIAVAMTVGVYGLVAGIVKLDDLGLYLSQRASAAAKAAGRGILAAAPYLMKALSIAGTAAMFLVGGGILVHGVPALHHMVEGWGASGGIASVLPMLGNAAIGAVVGAIVLAAVTGVQKLRTRA